MVLNEKQAALTAHEKQVNELTEKAAKAEERAAKLERSLAARNAEAQEMYSGFNSVQDTFVAQMNRLGGRINGLTSAPLDLNPKIATRSPESKDRANQTAINRMGGFEASLASFESSLASLRAQVPQQFIQLNGVEGVTYD